MLIGGGFDAILTFAFSEARFPGNRLIMRATGYNT